MGDILERISALTGPQKLGAAIATYVLIGAAIFFGMVSPTAEKITVAESRRIELTAERDETRTIAEHRDDWEKKVDRLNEELAKAIKELPNEREIPELLRRVSSIGKKIGLEFLLFQPMPEVRREFYADVPVKLKVEGSFHEVATFFDRIGKLNRIVNIRDIEMQDPLERSGKIILTTDGTAVTYRFLTDAELNPADNKRGGRR
jgi:type IV pilus assembly protein PilO